MCLSAASLELARGEGRQLVSEMKNINDLKYLPDNNIHLPFCLCRKPKQLIALSGLRKIQHIYIFFVSVSTKGGVASHLLIPEVVIVFH